MLGHIVYEYLKKQNYEVIGTTRKIEDKYFFDANHPERIIDIIKESKPDIIINCIGILNKECEENKSLAIKINSYLPHYLNELSKKYNFYLIHISTDCVFEGTIGNYNENSIPDATSFYGKTKMLGEVINDRNVTLRTSIVGLDNNPNGIGLFQWFMKQEKEIEGYSNVMWTGVTTIELAKQIKITIDNHLVGLQHVVNNNAISKKDLLELFKKYFNKDIEIKENNNVICNKTLIRTNLSYNFNIPTYEEMIKEMKKWENIYR